MFAKAVELMMRSGNTEQSSVQIAMCIHNQRLTANHPSVQACACTINTLSGDGPMMAVRAALLGGAVIITGGAQGADFPAKPAAPVDYVRICSTYGTGFFYIPGTETCLRVSGRVRAEYLYLEPDDRADDTIGFRARGRLNLDTRTATAYGLLRTYLRMEMARNTGAYGDSSTSPNIAQAFIQFGGLTAGRAVSFFTHPDLPVPNFGDLRFDDPSNAEVNLLAYTFSFGNGFSATLSLEEGRRVNNDLDFPLFGVGNPTPALAPIAFTYGGERIPDVVANLRYTGTWGGAQISGALHQIRDVAFGLTSVNGVTGPVINPVTGLPYPAYADTDYGFAIGAHAYANLPFLGTGDTGWISATYTDGAVGYINAGQAGSIGNAFIGAGPLQLAFADAFVDPITGEFETNKAYGIAGGLNHNWTPTIQTNVFGSWMRFDAPGIAQYAIPTTPATTAAGIAGATTGLVDFNEYRVGANVIWTPVEGFLIGVEALYIRVDPRGRVAVPIADATGAPTDTFQSTGSEDTWEGRLRIQRDF